MLHDKDSVRARLDDDVFASADLTVALPKYRMPDREHDPRHAYQLVHDELALDGNARLNLATFCQTWVEPQVHRLMNAVHRQEHGRQGRVSADRRARVALRAHPGRPVAFAGRGEHDGHVDDGLERGGDARRAWRCVEVARPAAAAGKRRRQAEHGVRSGPDLLAQVRALLRRRAAPGADGGRSADDVGRRGDQALSTRTRSPSCRRSA